MNNSSNFKREHLLITLAISICIAPLAHAQTPETPTRGEAEFRLARLLPLQQGGSRGEIRHTEHHELRENIRYEQLTLISLPVGPKPITRHNLNALSDWQPADSTIVWENWVLLRQPDLSAQMVQTLSAVRVYHAASRISEYVERWADLTYQFQQRFPDQNLRFSPPSPPEHKDANNPPPLFIAFPYRNRDGTLIEERAYFLRSPDNLLVFLLKGESSLLSKHFDDDSASEWVRSFFPISADHTQ